MNYRHIFHAGNHADVLKHAALAIVLEALSQKPAGFGVLETHAGIGVYDLAGADAARSPEWRGGIARVWADESSVLAALRALTASCNPDRGLRFYPGSPEIARLSLRAQDRYSGCELHPADAAALKERYRHDRRMQIHARDGWQALEALLPLPERRGLVLIDPPYEQPGELARAARAVGVAHRRFPQGSILWWRPLKDAGALDRADGEALAAGAPGLLRVDVWVAAPCPTGRLTGSSLALVRPPFSAAEALEALAATLARLLAVGPDAGFRITRLGAL